MLSQTIRPVVNQTERLKGHTLIVIESGSGLFEIDFRRYHFASGKGLFLAEGQYFKMITGETVISMYEFEGDAVTQIRDSRYLFKHLVSLGHIDISKNFESAFNGAPGAEEEMLLDASINNWIGLNPFGAPRLEVDLLFDMKEYIDQHYYKGPKVEEVAKRVGTTAPQLKRITKKRLELTFNKLTREKLLLESQRKVAFTIDSTKEIAYDLGFSNPAYFNRFFKGNTTLAPGDFRERFNFRVPDSFVVNFTELLSRYFKEEHFMGFYADKLNLTVKTLGRRLQNSFGNDFHSLLKDKLIEATKQELRREQSIADIAFSLGFKEPNHLSAFFKKYTGVQPSAFQT